MVLPHLAERDVLSATTKGHRAHSIGATCKPVGFDAQRP